MVVNKIGVLQYMSVNPTNENQEQQQTQYPQKYPQQHQQYPQQQQTQYPQQQQYPQQNQQQIKGKPLDPQVKNSHIFNKYFKDYKDPNVEYVEEVKVPQTIEEYNQMLLQDRIKRIQERNRIAQIKSTKLLFESNSSNNSINIGNNIGNNQNINASKNNLRMMKFN